MKTGLRVPKMESGFWRSDLIAILTVLSLLGLLLLPALGRTRAGSEGYQCLNNQRRLLHAWQLYASDNQDWLVMNILGPLAQAGAAANDPMIAPWVLGVLDWEINPDNTNVNLILDNKYARLAQYFGRNPRIYRCPADNYINRRQSQIGWKRRVRSYSMNFTVGDGNVQSGIWHGWDNTYHQVLKISHMLYPHPGETFVFLDEHPDSINDPGFFPPRVNMWVDQPAVYHDGSGALAFADGHAELHNWVASLSNTRAQQVKYSPWIANASRGDADLHWVASRCQRKKSQSH